MKRLIKWFFRLAFVLAAFFVLFVLLKDPILSGIAERRIRERTGLHVRIGKFTSGLLSPEVTLRDVTVSNPAGFGDSAFLSIPELHVELDPLALATRKLHITVLRFKLDEISIVRNESGQTNVFTLLNRLKPPPASETSGSGGGKSFEFAGIDRLNLSIGKTRFIDLTDPANNREVKLDLENQSFKNVKSEADVYGMVVLLWLRSGGKFSLNPNDVARDFIDRRVQDARESLRQAAEKMTGKPNADGASQAAK